MHKIPNRREIRLWGEAARRLISAWHGAPGVVALRSDRPELAGLLQGAVERNQLAPSGV